MNFVLCLVIFHTTEDLLGISLGIVGATEPRPVVPDVVDAGPECGDTLLDTTVGSYQLAYEPSTTTWALYKPETVEKRFLLCSFLIHVLPTLESN